MLLHGVSLIGIATLIVAATTDVPALTAVAIVSLAFAVLMNVVAIARELRNVLGE
jgi:hypothetical protein